MPAAAEPNAPLGRENAVLYAERLSVPKRWWLVATIGVAVGGAEVFAGFNWRVALVVYAALGLPTLALLIGMGHTTLRVDAAGLHAGGHTLPLVDIAAARVLDARETRHRVGPGADPAAHTVARGFIRESVLVRPVRAESAPYWLVSTRHGDQLVVALARAGRSRAERGDQSQGEVTWADDGHIGQP
jgi:hypothetical protein